MYLSDIFEQMENSIENRVEENMTSDGYYRCPGCGLKVELANTLPASANPYSIPLCRTCVEPPDDL